MNILLACAIRFVAIPSKVLSRRAAFSSLTCDATTYIQSTCGKEAHLATVADGIEHTFRHLTPLKADCEAEVIRYLMVLPESCFHLQTNGCIADAQHSRINRSRLTSFQNVSCVWNIVMAPYGHGMHRYGLYSYA